MDGTLAISIKKLKTQEPNYLLNFDIPYEEFFEDIQLFLDRYIMTQGNDFWNWNTYTAENYYRLENEVYVHIYKKGLVKVEFRHILSCLNRKEANFFRKLFSSNKGIYKIGDVEALIFLTKLSVNELYFINFFFPSLDEVIIGNWDLSFPVYSKTTKGFHKFKEIIEENGLFIRQ